MSEKIFENAVILAGKDLEPVEGFLKVRNGIIEEIGEGDSSEPGTDLKEGFVLPPFLNAHTHIGGSVRKGLYSNRSQEEVVGEEGEKFRALDDATDREKVDAMRESILEMKESGTLAHCDFREGGVEGSKLIKQAGIDSVNSIVLSRPDSDRDFEELLSSSDGIGLPSLDSFPSKDLQRMASDVSEANKLLSIHVSETETAHEKSLEETDRTEVERALSLNPNFLIHGTHATEGDLKSMRDSEVPLVICPRSNALLNAGAPPIKQALEKGTELWIGTDNASICSPNMLQELAYAWALLRLQTSKAGNDEARELLKAATVNPADDLDVPVGPIEEGGRAAFITLSKGRNLNRCEDPYVCIVNRARPGNVETIDIGIKES